MGFTAGQVLTAAGLTDVTLGDIQTYTPVLANGGTVTYTTRTGWYFKFGTHIVFMSAYFVINAGGSGATDITVTAPTNIDRTTRQMVYCEYVDGANNRLGSLTAFTSGSGSVFDKVRVTNAGTFGASTMSGAGLAAGATLAASGFYRSA